MADDSLFCSLYMRMDGEPAYILLARGHPLPTQFYKRKWSLVLEGVEAPAAAVATIKATGFFYTTRDIGELFES